jgi:hypothetical protein
MAGRSGSSGVHPARFAVVAAAGMLLGCVAPGLGPPTPYPHAPPGEIAVPADRAEPPWPPSLMTHRVILSIGGSEFPLDGRLAVGERGALRLVALGAMGQVAFDLLAEPGREPRALRVAPVFPEAWVRTFAGRDLAAAFRAPAAAFRAVGDATVPGSGRRLEMPDGTELLYFAAAEPAGAPARWSRIEGVRAGACVYRVTALEERRFEGLDRPVPSRVRVEAVGYALDIRIVEFKPGAPPARLFQEGTDEAVGPRPGVSR